MEFVEFRCAEFTISNYPLVSSGRTLPAERCTILPGRVRPGDRDQVDLAPVVILCSHIQATLALWRDS